MYHTEPPTDKTIREWYMNSSRVAACALRNCGGTWKYAKAPSTKKTWRDSVPIDMFLSAVSVLVVAQSSSEIPEGLLNNPVFYMSAPHPGVGYAVALIASVINWNKNKLEKLLAVAKKLSVP